MLQVWPRNRRKKKKTSRFPTHSMKDGRCFSTPTGVFVSAGVALGWNRSLLVFGPTTNGPWQNWRSNRTANSASQPWPLLLWILNKPLRVQTTEPLGFWCLSNSSIYSPLEIRWVENLGIHCLLFIFLFLFNPSGPIFLTISQLNRDKTDNFDMDGI